MRLEDIRIELRPRGPWEAMDLGLTMMRTWWKPVFGVWFALSLPLFLVLNAATGASAWAGFALWWLKPVLERPLLHVYSRAAFGSTPTVGETLRAFPRMLVGTGLLWHLTIGRLLDFARAFRLPVMQLEGLKGRARRDRLRVIGARDGGHAFMMAVMYLHIQTVLFIGMLALAVLLVPTELHYDPFDSLVAENVWVQFLVNLLVWLSMALVEPAHVASGFALYLNRRTVLEAWDIELNLRRMAARLGSAAIGLVAIALTATLLLAPEPALAQKVASKTHEHDPQVIIEEVLSDPIFGEERTVERWRPKRSDDDDDEREEADRRDLDGFGETLALVFRGIAWAIMAVAAVLLLRAVWRHRETLFAWAGRRRGPRETFTVPERIGSLQLSPDTLPDDIGAAAEAAWREGQARDAVALLYRGTIVRLVAGGVRLRAADTEADVLRRSEPLLPDDPMQALRTLVLTWQQLAYAHRQPADDRFAGLVAGFRDHFEPQSS